MIANQRRSRRSRSTLLRALLVVAGCGVCVLLAYASPIVAGQDSYRTQDASLDSSATQIPASLFDPGSDPFPDIIPLHGSPLAPGATTDTVIQRLDTAKPHGPDHIDTIPIEIVSLSLVSAAPITVTYSGGLNPEPWDVRVGLTTSQQPVGSMTITQTSGKQKSGSFDSTLPVLLRLTFTRQSDGAVRVLDLPQLDLRARIVPWTSTTTDSSIIHSKGFCPACDSPDGAAANMFESGQGASFDLVPATTAP